MRLIVLALLLAAATAAPDVDASREAALARLFIEDAAIRHDDVGLRLGRERAALLAAAAEASADRRLAHDAHALVALAAWAQIYTGHNALDTIRSLAGEGTRHADRAAALDERSAEALVLGSALRAAGFLFGGMSPAALAEMRERLQRAVALDPGATPVGVLDGLARSIDPAGPARPEGIAVYDELVRRLDAHGTGEASTGFWEVQARAWHAIVRLQTVEPDVAAIRGAVARLVALRPDAALGGELQARVEHRAWAPAAVVEGLAWRPLADDAAGDGARPEAPDVRALAFATDAQRAWFRIAFERPLPPSFGVNVAVDRDGDARGDAPWWGTGSRFRFDRLVTAWVVADGDGYFGNVGLTDAPGATARRLAKLSTDVALHVAADRRSVVVGVPAALLDLGPQATGIAAGGTHLLWNDDVTAAAGAGAALPAQ